MKTTIPAWLKLLSLLTLLLTANSALAIPPAITGVTGPPSETYLTGQTLSFTVNYSAAVTVDTTGGTPTLPLTIGATARSASYASGSGGTALVFSYTVQGTDFDADGIASAAPLVLNGGTIKDGSANDAGLTFTPPTTTAVLVGLQRVRSNISSGITIFVRPGGTTYPWTFGTANTGTGPFSSLLDWAFYNVGAPINWALTRARLEYSSDGGVNWTTVNLASPTYVTVAGKLWRCVDTTPGDPTTANSVGNGWHLVVSPGSTTGSGGNVIPDNAPTDITSGKSTIFSTAVQGDTVATITPTDTGDTQGGYWAIDSQSVPNLFTLTFDNTTGNTATLKLGTGTVPAIGQTARITLRYYDVYQTDFSGVPIPGQGFSKTLTYTVVSEVSNDLTLGNDLPVNTYTGDDQSAPAIVQLSTGNAVVVWQSDGQGRTSTGLHSIRGQLLSSAGAKVGSEFLVSNSGTGVDDLTPSVAALNSGRFVVAYTTKAAANSATAFRIIEANGTVGSEVTVAGGALDHYNPAVATLTDGSFVVVWSDGNGDVRLHQFNSSDGSSAAAEVLIASGYFPSVAALSNGSYAVAWLDGTTGNVFIKVGGGSAVDTGIVPAGYVPPRLAGQAGGFVVASDSYDAGTTRYQIDAVRYNNSAVIQGSVFRVNTLTAGNRYAASVATLTGGGFIIGWMSDTDDYDLNGLFGRRYDANGTAADTTEFEINQHRANDQAYPALAPLASDAFAAAWTGTPAGASIGDIYARVLLPAPAVTSISPTSGSTAGGTSVTITGTDFTGATGVTIGGTAATSVNVASATSITCTTPMGTAGTASVVVTTPGGANGANTLFTYVVPNVAPSFTLPPGVAQGPWTVATLAGTAGTNNSLDGTGAAAGFNQPFGVAVDGAGIVYVADTYNHTIRKITPAGVVTTLAGTPGMGGSTDGAGAAARFLRPIGLAVDVAGNVYVGDYGNAAIRKITAAGDVTTLAGTAGNTGSADGNGAAARFNLPYGVTVDSGGNVYVADNGNSTIRKITPTGDVTTLAGLAGVSGGTDDTGAAARFFNPTGVAVDSLGNVFVADNGNSTIRKITPAGAVTTLAGTAATTGALDGMGGVASFAYPIGVTVDRTGNVYVTDSANQTIRKITAAGLVTTVAGLAGVSGSADGTGAVARFNNPAVLAVDGPGNLYVADSYSSTIRKITPAISISNQAAVLVAEDSGAFAGGAGFATAISPGPANEASQTVSFTVTNDNNALFSAQPAIDASGTLTFTPLITASGTATVTVIAHDNGGTDFGGVDTSAPQTFTITVTPVNDAPTFVLPTGAAKLGVFAWGWNSWKQLGDGSSVDRHAPVFSQLPNATQLAGGDAHSLALLADGTVWAVGANYTGQLGDGTTTGRATPVPVSGLSGVIHIAANGDQSFAVKSDGTLWAWGGNANGRLGDGTTTQKLVPAQVLSGVAMVAAGHDHTVATKSDGTVWAWGYNGYGQLGNGTTTDNPTPSQVAGLTDVTLVAAGWFHSVARKSDGTLWAWGNGDNGQLGTGSVGRQSAPVQVRNPANSGFLSGVASIAAGSQSTLAVMADTTVLVFGYQLGGLGDGTSGAQYLPVPVTGLSGVTAVAASYFHTLATKSDGTVWAWGYNNEGELGNGTTANSAVPVLVPGLSNATAIAVGYLHSLAVAATNMGTPNVTVFENTGASSISGFAASIAAGPANEAGQTVNFTVTNDNPALFSAQPAINAAGTLSFTPAASAVGMATVTVIAHDNGGTDFGGVDTSAPQTFTITVMPVNDAPSFTLRPVTAASGPWTVSTIAGTPGSTGSTDATGAAARFNQPFGLAVDGAGNIYVADRSNHTIRKMSAAGVVTTLAGTAGGAGSANGTGAAAQFNAPVGVAVDLAGNVYVGDMGNQTVRKITPGGVVTTLAGMAGSSGTADGTGAAARFNGPAGVAVDAAGNVYVADLNNRVIRKITAGGMVTTLAGLAGSSGSANGTGAAARFLYPVGVAVDVAGNVYVAEMANHTIRKVTPGGVVTTLAGLAGNSGSADGTGAAARFNQPTAVTVDGAGNVFAVDGNNHTVRKITAGGVVTTIAGLAGSSGHVDGVGAVAKFSKPYGLAADSAGNLFLAETYYFTLRKLTPGTAATASFGVLEDSGARQIASFATGIVAGPANEAGQTVSFLVSNDNPGLFAAQPAMDATGRLTYTPAAHANGSALVTVIAMDNGGTDNGAVDKSTNIFTLTVTAVNDAPTIAFAATTVTVLRNSCPYHAPFATITTGPANEAGQAITSVTVSNDNPALFAGQPALSGGNLSFTPAAHAIGAATVTVIVQDNGGTANGGINKATNTFTITVQAVNEAPDFALPAGVAQGPWTVSTLAGTAQSSGSADGTGAAARFTSPFGVVMDGAGNLIVSDRFNHTIRRITPAGVVTTIAGTAGVAGTADGVGAAARFNAPAGVAIDRAGNVYVADSNNRTVRVLAPGGAVTTLAGLPGVSGSADGTGAAARFLYPFGITVDDDGNVYVSDASNRTIRKVTPCGVVTTLAGLAGNAGTADGPGAAARFGNPFGLAVDAAGTVYVADQSSHTIRQITFDGIVSTLAGSAGNAGSADGIGAAARFNKPTAVAVDYSGNVYVLDGDNFTVRQIAPGGVVTTLAGLPGATGTANGAGTAARFNRAYGVIVDRMGNLRITDTGNHTVRQLTPVQSTTPHITVSSAAGAQTGPGFVTTITVGPPDEAAQAVSFLVTNDNAALFTVAPAIAPDGTLTFTPAPGMSGTAVVTIIAQDNGGTANGGVDTSTPRTVLITVTTP